ncbi:glycosyltransferase [Enterococcus sp. 22-H-5-01]|uniref:glycosyltransferase n=1 Tax=Enterococcus sp. 22-H-5-01 TaxID=3418555 RepID=UPI003CFE1CD2
MFELIVVLYNMTYSDSPTINSLNKLLTSDFFPEIQKVLIFDNSDQVAQPSGLEARFVYQHSQENVGLAKAYNYAIKQRGQRTEWLLTLDQDTQLTNAYLKEMLLKAKTLPEKVVAIAPVIMDQQQQISPVRSDALRPLHKELPQSDQIFSSDIMVINSGTAIRIDFLLQINGYNEKFPLDYLDHWLSWKIFAEQRQLYNLKTILQHELSVLHYEELSVERYQSILRNEAIFYNEFNVRLLRDYHRQLFVRGMKQVFLRRFSIAKITFSFLIYSKNK